MQRIDKGPGPGANHLCVTIICPNHRKTNLTHHSRLIKGHKRGKCTMAGDNDDNNACHQAPNGRTNI